MLHCNFVADPRCSQYISAHSCRVSARGDAREALLRQEPTSPEPRTPNPLGGLFWVPCLPSHTRQGHDHTERGTRRLLPPCAALGRFLGGMMNSGRRSTGTGYFFTPSRPAGSAEGCCAVFTSPLKPQPPEVWRASRGWLASLVRTRSP